MEIKIKKDKNIDFFEDYWTNTFYKKKKDERLVDKSLEVLKDKIEILMKKMEKIIEEKEKREENERLNYVLIGGIFFENSYFDPNCELFDTSTTLLKNKSIYKTEDYYLHLKDYFAEKDPNYNNYYSPKIEDFTYNCYKAIRSQVKPLEEDDTFDLISRYKEELEEDDPKPLPNNKKHLKEISNNLNLEKVKITIPFSIFEYFNQENEYLIRNCDSLQEFKETLNKCALDHIQALLCHQYEYATAYFSCIEHKTSSKIISFFKNENKTIDQYFNRISSFEKRYQKEKNKKEN